MEIQDIANKIIYLPAEYRRLGNESIYSLLKKTGYFETYEQINKDILIQSLNHNSECVNHWMDYSADKRASSGWYFNQNEQGKYIVGYYPPNEIFKDTEYSEMLVACATYILNEIEDIRKI